MNHTESVNTLRGQKAELLKLSGIKTPRFRAHDTKFRFPPTHHQCF